MNGKEFDYNGSAWNGFLMFFLNIAMYGLSGWTFVEGIMASDADESCAVWFVLSCILFIAAITASCGFSMLEPNEAKVMTFFGKYVGTFRKNGFYWINPFMSAKNVSLRARNLNAEPIKVNDKTGNPVMIGLVLVWRLRDTYKAIFDIDTTVSSTEQASGSATARMNKFEKFVAVQSDSALREVAGMYAYDSDNESEVTLRDGSDEINQKLKAKLNERLAMAGMEAVEARINYLAYAPEIAAVMLRGRSHHSRPRKDCRGSRKYGETGLGETGERTDCNAVARQEGLHGEQSACSALRRRTGTARCEQRRKQFLNAHCHAGRSERESFPRQSGLGKAQSGGLYLGKRERN